MLSDKLRLSNALKQIAVERDKYIYLKNEKVAQKHFIAKTKDVMLFARMI